jgi:hypothetical protein
VEIGRAKDENEVKRRKNSCGVFVVGRLKNTEMGTSE